MEASKAGYVTPNWTASTKEDPTSIHNAYLTAETTTKVPYKLAPASTLNVTFKSAAEVVTGDSFVAFNAGMAAVQPTLGPIGTYANTLTTGAKAYPFTSKYEVYAGSCPEDSPHAVEPALKPGEVLLPAGGSVTTSVAEPPIAIKVMSGYNSANAGSAVSGGSGYLTDTGCTTKRTFTTTATGALPHPAMPYGTYKLCVANKERYWLGEVVNNKATGPSSTVWPNGGVSGGVATIYLGYSPSGAPAGVKVGVCP